jgi:hypothetical protein
MTSLMYRRCDEKSGNHAEIAGEGWFNRVPTDYLAYQVVTRFRGSLLYIR